MHKKNKNDFDVMLTMIWHLRSANNMTWQYKFQESAENDSHCEFALHILQCTAGNVLYENKEAQYTVSCDAYQTGQINSTIINQIWDNFSDVCVCSANLPSQKTNSNSDACLIANTTKYSFMKPWKHNASGVYGKYKTLIWRKHTRPHENHSQAFCQDYRGSY